MSVFDFGNLKVSRAIFLVPVVPLLVALAFSTILVLEKVNEARQLDRLSQLISPIALITQAVHEQQKERGATSVFLSSGGKEFKQELADQRLKTDSRHAEILTFVAQNDLGAIDAAFWDQLSGYQAWFQDIASTREKVDQLAISAKSAIELYTNLNTDMLDLVQRVSLISDDKRIADETLAFVHLLKGKEAAGIERAVGSGGFAAGHFDIERAGRLKGLIEAQAVNFDNFRFMATPAALAAYEKMQGSEVVQKVERMRNIALGQEGAGNLGGFTGGDFFNLQTERINQLKNIENLISDELQILMAQQKGATDKRLIVLALASLGAIGLALMISVYFAGQIRRGFGQLVITARELADGNLEIEFPPVQTNEFGEVMATLDVFRHNSIERRAMAIREAKEREARIEMQRREQEREAELARQDAERECRIAQKREEQLQREMQVAEEIATVVNACAWGKFDRRLDPSQMEGAFAEIGTGLNRVCDVTEKGLNQISHALAALAGGDLTYQMTGDYDGVFAEIQAQVNSSITRLSASFARVRDSGSVISGSTQEIAGATQDLAIRTERTAATLEETTSAIKTLSQSVTGTAGLAAEVNAAAMSANDKVRSGNELVQSTVSAIREIQTSSGAIGAAIRLIDDITFQTNLLALNAGVEAARAGEAGRGFAVVASEVRDLAARSSRAAGEISELVKRSEEEVDRGVAMVDRTGAALQSIAEAVSEIVERIDEIAKSAADQSVSIQEITVAAEQLDQVTQQNAAMFEQASSSGVSLRMESENLDGIIATFRIAEHFQSQNGGQQPTKAA
ncbi:HAMP domain-containing protein [Aliiroseovarius crassostreae]|uniref:Chemotaxis protein n=1 Tax=Aliiroseovarius crassostreae TaxID=154981 RepID=A0A0P7J6U8_9RHOB|nr:nitrate- and nitrite sensing domain-containing protein [Aliiroseovarius crassostreae]KPN64006.1 hypothetical protein AKJ29_15165 [Aliiroseovarius crassostreae]SFU51330.1 HAMP domain-containing protein [Aliiroseovarius crassostreae]